MTETKKSWIWPSVADLPSAIHASDQAFWAAVIVAAITAAFATFAVTSGRAIAAIDGWAYVDAAVFAIVAWRIKRRSRAWAVVGLALFLFEKALQVAQTPSAASGLFLGLVITLLLIGGVRGNFAIHKLTQAQVEPQVGA